MRLWHSALYRVLVPDIALTIFNTVLLNITLEEWWSFLFVLNRFVHFPLYIIFVHIPVDTTQICDCFPRGSADKESICNVEDLGSIPGLGKSPGEGNDTHPSILAWRIPWTEPRKESDTNDQLSLTHSLDCKRLLKTSCSCICGKNRS